MLSENFSNMIDDYVNYCKYEKKLKTDAMAYIKEMAYKYDSIDLSSVKNKPYALVYGEDLSISKSIVTKVYCKNGIYKIDLVCAIGEPLDYLSSQELYGIANAISEVIEKEYEE